MRKLTTFLTALVVLATVAGCSSSSSDGKSSDKTTTTASKTSTTADKAPATTDPKVAGATAQDYATNWATGLSSGDESSGQLVLGKDEATCVAAKWVDAIGVQAFKDADVTPDDVNNADFDGSVLDISPKGGQAMYDAFAPCKVDVVDLFVTSLTQGLDQSKVDCATKNVDAKKVEALLVKTFSNQNNDAEFTSLTGGLSKACGIG